MAQTETKVAQVTLRDAMENNRTINIDNPKDDLSLNQIKTAFAPAISGGWLLSSSGSPITEVVEAKYNQVIKTQINGLPVTVSPSSLTLNISGAINIGGRTSGAVTVSNGTVKSATTSIAGVEGKTSFSVEITATSVTVYAYKLSDQSAQTQFTLKIFLEGSETAIEVPVTLSQGV